MDVCCKEYTQNALMMKYGELYIHESFRSEVNFSRYQGTVGVHALKALLGLLPLWLQQK